jgi:hypothetical protein
MIIYLRYQLMILNLDVFLNNEIRCPFQTLVLIASE